MNRNNKFFKKNYADQTEIVVPLDLKFCSPENWIVARLYYYDYLVCLHVIGRNVCYRKDLVKHMARKGISNEKSIYKDISEMCSLGLICVTDNSNIISITAKGLAVILRKPYAFSSQGPKLYQVLKSKCLFNAASKNFEIHCKTDPQKYISSLFVEKEEASKGLYVSSAIVMVSEKNHSNIKQLTIKAIFIDLSIEVLGMTSLNSALYSYLERTLKGKFKFNDENIVDLIRSGKIKLDLLYYFSINPLLEESLPYIQNNGNCQRKF